MTIGGAAGSFVDTELTVSCSYSIGTRQTPAVNQRFARVNPRNQFVDLSRGHTQGDQNASGSKVSLIMDAWDNVVDSPSGRTGEPSKVSIFDPYGIHLNI